MSRVQSAVPSYRMMLLVLGCLLLAALWGVQDVAGQSKAAVWSVRLVMGCLMTAIVWQDSLKWKRPMPGFTHWLVFLAWPVALPICLFRTRRIRGVIKGITFFGLLAVIYVAAVIGAWTLLERQAWRAHAAGDYEQAVRIYDRLIEIDPSDEWAIENRAAALEAIEDSK